MRVAVAVITDHQQRILITRRSLESTHPGFWEFPGGKLEQDEQPSEALVREVKEEVGLDVFAYDYLGEISHSYNKKAISLLVYHVHGFHGRAFCHEKQMDMQWAPLKALKNFQFPAANFNIIELIQERFLELANR